MGINSKQRQKLEHENKKDYWAVSQDLEDYGMLI